MFVSLGSALVNRYQTGKWDVPNKFGVIFAHMMFFALEAGAIAAGIATHNLAVGFSVPAALEAGYMFRKLISQTTGDFQGRDTPLIPEERSLIPEQSRGSMLSQLSPEEEASAQNAIARHNNPPQPTDEDGLP